MQSACMGALMALAEQDTRVLYLTADSGEGGLDRIFRMNFPDRSFDFGIAEGNMVSAAAGLAAGGKIPFVYTAGPFLAYRSYEFIRDDLCLQNLNVKLIGSGSGLSVSSLGPTHHTTEDIAALRALPNLRILSPATPRQAGACIRDAYRHPGPVYIRLAMNRETEYFPKEYDTIPDAPEVMGPPADILLFSTGSILDEAMQAADRLQKDGVPVCVVNVPVLKPLPAPELLALIGKAKLCVTVEEHNILGGLGSALAELMAENYVSARLRRIGLEDGFAIGYGTVANVRRENGLDGQTIAERIREALR